MVLHPLHPICPRFHYKPSTTRPATGPQTRSSITRAVSLAAAVDPSTCRLPAMTSYRSRTGLRSAVHPSAFDPDESRSDRGPWAGGQPGLPLRRQDSHETESSSTRRRHPRRRSGRLTGMESADTVGLRTRSRRGARITRRRVSQPNAHCDSPNAAVGLPGVLVLSLADEPVVAVTDLLVG
jgi:hypothetical protein